MKPRPGTKQVARMPGHDGEAIQRLPTSFLRGHRKPERARLFRTEVYQLRGSSVALDSDFVAGHRGVVAEGDAVLGSISGEHGTGAGEAHSQPEQVVATVMHRDQSHAGEEE